MSELKERDRESAQSVYYLKSGDGRRRQVNKDFMNYRFYF